jgi:SAM-dependent methyltransferase/pimeloyl-ACP methyl ester carboxylesterase
MRVSRLEPDLGLLELGRLHSDAIRDQETVREKFQAAQEGGIALHERACSLGAFRVADCGDDRVTLRHLRRALSSPARCLFEFTLGSGLYYFTSKVFDSSDGLISIRYPAVLYRAERRDRARIRDEAEAPISMRVEGREITGRIVDRSPSGIGLIVERDPTPPLGAAVSLCIPGEAPASTVLAEVRNFSVDAERGWKRVGLSLIPQVGRGNLAHLRIDDDGSHRRRSLRPRSASARPTNGRSENRVIAQRVPVVRFQNSARQHLAGILDTWGDPRGATAVVIPPAWGRTKETLLPLAATIVRTFAAAEKSIAVLRFDGTCRRGESYVPPGVRGRGLESERFSFSQAVEDLRAAIDYMRDEFSSARVVVVTFSAAAIEGRRIVAENNGAEIAGWIAVVGATDPQALIRGTQRGVDYFAGYEAGHRYGLQEVQGVVIDVDHAVRDAIEHRLAFIDDARRDFAQIHVPVTWIHGRDDGWIDTERVRDVLSIGDTTNRRLLEVPTGHQLRTSRQAFEVFRAIAAEVSRMATGEAAAAVTPEVDWLRERRRAERARLPRLSGELRRFWKDYLLGRDETLGIELVAATTSYRQLMVDQISALSLRPGERVVDLGSGAGSFVGHLLGMDVGFEGLHVTEVDYVSAALKRARSDLGPRCSSRGVTLACVEADLDLIGSATVPFATASADAVLASLVINYVRSPERLLREIRRILSASGRLVLSSLRPDADISRICVEGVAELRTGRGLEAFGVEGEGKVSRSLAGFINDASQLLDFEERGLFSFWEREDLVSMLRRAGFECVSMGLTFGLPPQAFVAVARLMRSGA